MYDWLNKLSSNCSNVLLMIQIPQWNLDHDLFESFIVILQRNFRKVRKRMDYGKAVAIDSVQVYLSSIFQLHIYHRWAWSYPFLIHDQKWVLIELKYFGWILLLSWVAGRVLHAFSYSSRHAVQRDCHKDFSELHTFTKKPCSVNYHWKPVLFQSS